MYISRKILKILRTIFSFFIFCGLSGTLFAQAEEERINVMMPKDARVVRVDVKIDQWVFAGDTLAVLKDSKGAKFKFRTGISGKLVLWRLQPLMHYRKGETVGIIQTVPVINE